MINYRKHEKYIGSVFCFGAGVQSTAILLMIKYEPEKIIKIVGHLPDWILFSDTGGESQESLENLERCKTLLPIVRVKNWKRNAQTRPSDAPWFLGSNGMNKRQCTAEWKITPVHKAIRKLYPNKSPKRVVSQWLGISTDEVIRMKESRLKSIEHIYPLIEMGMDRNDCHKILNKYNWNTVKSKCYFCPYQRDWTSNNELDKAIKYEQDFQSNHPFKLTPYLHYSAQNLDTAIEKQEKQRNLFSFLDECDGHCGL